MSLKVHTFWNEYWTLIFLALHLSPSFPDNEERQSTVNLLTRLGDSFFDPGLKLSYRDYQERNPIRLKSYTRENLIRWLYQFLVETSLTSFLTVNVLQLEKFSTFLAKKFLAKYQIDPVLLVGQPGLLSYFVDLILGKLRIVSSECHLPVLQGTSDNRGSTQEAVKSLSVALYTHYPVQISSRTTLHGQVNQIITSKLEHDRNFLSQSIPLEHQYQLHDKHSTNRSLNKNRQMSVSERMSQRSAVPFNISLAVTRELHQKYPMPPGNPVPKVISQKHLLPQRYTHTLAVDSNRLSKSSYIPLVTPGKRSSLNSSLNFVIDDLVNAPKVVSNHNVPRIQDKIRLRIRPKPKVIKEEVVDLSTGREEDLPPYLRPIPSFRTGGTGGT
jgi:hypothetical protein